MKFIPLFSGLTYGFSLDVDDDFGFYTNLSFNDEFTKDLQKNNKYKIASFVKNKKIISVDYSDRSKYSWNLICYDTNKYIPCQTKYISYKGFIILFQKLKYIKNDKEFWIGNMDIIIPIEKRIELVKYIKSIIHETFDTPDIVLIDTRTLINSMTTCIKGLKEMVAVYGSFCTILDEQRWYDIQGHLYVVNKTA